MDITSTVFYEAGFEVKGGQFVKDFKAEDLPYFVENVIDNQSVCGQTNIQVKVSLAKEEVIMESNNSDYYEGPYSINSGEGRQVLQEAGVNFVR